MVSLDGYNDLSPCILEKKKGKYSEILLMFLFLFSNKMLDLQMCLSLSE